MELIMPMILYFITTRWIL